VVIALLTWSRFGNYIGEADESDEEDLQQAAAADAYLDADDDDEADEEAIINDQQLMDLDSARHTFEVLSMQD